MGIDSEMAAGGGIIEEDIQEEDPFTSKQCSLWFKMNVPKSVVAAGSRKWQRAYGSVIASTIFLSGDETGLTGPEGSSFPLAWNLEHIEVVVTLVQYNLCFALQNKVNKSIILWLRFDDSKNHDEFKAAITDTTDPTKRVRALKKPVIARKKVVKAPKIVKGKSNTDPPDETDEQRHKRHSALIRAQSISYSRKTQQLKEHWLKPGNLAPFPSNARTRIHPGHKWDKRAKEVILKLLNLLQ